MQPLLQLYLLLFLSVDGRPLTTGRLTDQFREQLLLTLQVILDQSEVVVLTGLERLLLGIGRGSRVGVEGGLEWGGIMKLVGDCWWRVIEEGWEVAACVAVK